MTATRVPSVETSVVDVVAVEAVVNNESLESLESPPSKAKREEKKDRGTVYYSSCITVVWFIIFPLHLALGLYKERPLCPY